MATTYISSLPRHLSSALLKKAHTHVAEDVMLHVMSSEWGRRRTQDKIPVDNIRRRRINVSRLIDFLWQNIKFMNFSPTSYYPLHLEQLKWWKSEFHVTRTLDWVEGCPRA